jgi:PAS domain S-box-containing protein
LTGYKCENLIGKNLFDLNLVPKNQVTKAIRSLNKCSKGEANGTYEFSINKKDGGQIIAEI